jgi:tetratricopeptide (TPR) repeat protein
MEEDGATRPGENRSMRRRIRVLVLGLIVVLEGIGGVFAGSAAGDQGSKSKDKAHRQAEKAIRGGKYAEAIRLYEGILREYPDEVRARLGEALAHLKSFDYVECFDLANEAARLDPASARARALAGVALLRSGFVNRATEQLLLAFGLDNKEPLAFGAAAEIDYYEGRAREAREKALYAYNLDPREPDYLVTLARASSRVEMFSEAADAYEEFLRIAPKNDVERRDRIVGLIRFYRQLSGQKVHEVSGAENTEVPFRLGNDRRPYIKVTVNGFDANFVVDTGSGFTVLSREAATRFNVREIARGGNSQGIGGDGRFPIVYGLIKTLQIGDTRIKTVPCFVRPFHGDRDRSAEDRADGFIGLSVLAHFLTELDYEASVIRLDRSVDREPLQPAADVTVVPFRTTQNGLISIEAELDGSHSINTILDSGASSTVVSSAAIKRLNLRDSIIKGQNVRVVGAAGIANNVELVFIHNCRVADLHQSNMRALVLDFGAINETSGFEQSAILGGDFLRHFRVTIDFSRGKLGLQPYTSAVFRQ